MLLLHTDELKDLLNGEEIVECVEAGYRQWAAGRAFNHPRQSLQAGPTRLRIISGAMPELGAIGTRIHCDYLRLERSRSTIVPGASEKGHVPQVVVLYDYAGGGLLAILIGDGYRLHVPPATSAVAAKYLSRPGSQRMGLIGAGRTAEDFVRLFSLVRPIRRVTVYSRSAERRRAFAEGLGRSSGIEVVPVDSAQDAVSGADIVISATSADRPTFDGHWLSPGTFVTQIVAGNQGEHLALGLPSRRRELDDVTVARAGLIVTNCVEQIRVDQQGTMIEPMARGLVRWEDIHELTEILSGRFKLRISSDQIVLFYHAGGQGVGDISMAMRLYEKAKERGLGRELPL